jgi:hypothetical protein
MGMQEPFSVLFSLLNFLAHDWGMNRLRERIPASYTLRWYYLAFGYVGLASWTFSMIFHTRDFGVTEKLDYFAAGANVLYGLYYAPIRVFCLDVRTPRKQSVLRFWTVVCLLLYTMHVAYLSLWRWDYTYNMAANVVVGTVANVLWSGFSYVRYKRIGRTWAVLPGICVAWIISAMSLELMDFAPWRGVLDAHALWHLGTVVPTLLWYKYVHPHYTARPDVLTQLVSLSRTHRRISRVRTSKNSLLNHMYTNPTRRHFGILGRWYLGMLDKTRCTENRI